MPSSNVEDRTRPRHAIDPSADLSTPSSHRRVGPVGLVGPVDMTARRAALALGLAATCLLANTAIGADAEKVSFATNWFAQPEHGGYYQGVAAGHYADCGLEVEIVPGGPQVNNRALLLAGKLDFNMGGNLLQAFSAIEQGIPLRIVAASFQKEPQVIMSHPDQGLDTWESLLEAEEYIIGDNGFQSYFQWMMDEFGFDASRRVPYTYNSAAFIASPRSVQQGYITSEPFAIEKEAGFAPNLFLLADAGFSTYSTTIEVMQKTLDERPETVECFVDATAQGWYGYLYGDNAAANELIKADNPEMSDEQIAFSIDKIKTYGLIDSGDTLEQGIGSMSAERIEAFYQKMVSAGVVADGLDIDKVYTLDYVNKGVGLDMKPD